jgi:hypothetical protein
MAPTQMTRFNLQGQQVRVLDANPTERGLDARALALVPGRSNIDHAQVRGETEVRLQSVTTSEIAAQRVASTSPAEVDHVGPAQRSAPHRVRYQGERAIVPN